MQRLVLVGKLPRAGRVKTRLVPLLGERRTLELYRAFLADQLAFLAAFADRCQVEWCADGPVDPADADESVLAPAGMAVTEQGAGDLGRRLTRLFELSARDGATATVVIGADSPTLPSALVESAFDALAGGAAATIAPADDGGYVLLGLRRSQPELLDGIPWGGPGVLAATRRAAARAGIALVELPGWYDIDDAGGLQRLRGELDDADARDRAPATARLLRSTT